MEANIDMLFKRLEHSKFRSQFQLKEKDIDYIKEKGLEKIQQHAYDFIKHRLAPDFIPNDGKQTPMKGHPVFLAQHATATCCRGCLYKWHKIKPNTLLTKEQQDYIVTCIMTWIGIQLKNNGVFHDIKCKW